MVLISMAGLTIVTLVVLGFPFFSKWEQVADGQAPDELTWRKTSLFQDISDLEFDRDTGKVADTDYESMRTEYEVEAAQVMAKIDRESNGQALGSSCPECGSIAKATDQFCGDCGHRLAEYQV